MSPTYDSLRDDIDILDERNKGVQRTLAATRIELARTQDALDACMAGAPVDPPIIVDPPIVVPPDPPVTKPPTTPGDAWPHALARSSVADAAAACEARVMPILEAAPARTDVGYDIVYRDLHLAGRNGYIANEMRAGRWGKSYGCNRHHNADGSLVPRSTVLVMDNIELAGPWDDQSSGAKWFVRMSNIPQATMTRFNVVGEDLKGRNFPKEHGCYLDVSGDVTFADSLYKNIGGHGVYVTNRAYSFQQYGFISLPFTAPPTWTFDNVIQLHNEQDASRSAFDFTFYDPGSYEHPGEVIVKDCASIQAWPYQRPQGTNERHPVEPYRPGETRASGGLVVTNYDHSHMGREGAWPTERVVITRSYFRAVQARHNLISISGAKHVLLKDSTFIAEGPGANTVIHIGAKERDGLWMAEPRSVVLENCVAPGMSVEIARRDGLPAVSIDANCPGRRVTWTPENGARTALCWRRSDA